MHECIDHKGNKYAEMIDDNGKLTLWFMPYRPEPGYTQMNYCPMCGYKCKEQVPYDTE